MITKENIVTEARIEEAVREAGMTLFRPGLDAAAHKEACFRSDVGITGALFGVAETGSLALVFDGENPRLVSHAPFCHIALLKTKDILPDAETLFEKLAERGIAPSAMALATGPSTTSDIALTPTRGIHGPGKVFVILID